MFKNMNILKSRKTPHQKLHETKKHIALHLPLSRQPKNV